MQNRTPPLTHPTTKQSYIHKQQSPHAGTPEYGKIWEKPAAAKALRYDEHNHRKPAAASASNAYTVFIPSYFLEMSIPNHHHSVTATLSITTQLVILVLALRLVRRSGSPHTYIHTYIRSGLGLRLRQMYHHQEYQ